MLSASRFRALALAVAATAFAGALVAADAIARYGDRTREFGWTVVPGDGASVVRILPDGHDADGLRDGDRIIDGDRRAERVSPLLRPFRGRTHSELLMAIVNDTLVLGGEGGGRRRLEAILQRAVAKDPSARFASVDEFAAAMLPALRDLRGAVPAGDGSEITVA